MIARARALLAGDGLRARALRGTALTFLGFGAQQFLRLLSNLILTRLLFPEAFGLMALAGLVMVATGLWMRLEHFAPGIGWMPEGLGYDLLFDIHEASGVLAVPLLGAFCGFASRDPAGRLAGWNGLAIAVALGGFLWLSLPLYQSASQSAFLDGLMSGATALPGLPALPELTDNRSAIASAAGLWALYAGAGALIGAAPGFRWPGRIMQLIAGVFCALYLLAATQGAAAPGLHSLLLIPALALLTLATLQLTRHDTAPAPHLWCGAALLCVMLLTSLASYNFLEGTAGTLAEAADIYVRIYGLAPFALIAAWRSYRGWDHGGLWAWGHGVTLLALIAAISSRMTDLGYRGMPIKYADFPEAFAGGTRELTLLSILLVGWILLGFTRPKGWGSSPSAAHGS